MSIDHDHSHGAPREGHSRPDMSEHMIADGARGALIGRRRKLLVILLAALVLTIVGVGAVVFGNSFISPDREMQSLPTASSSEIASNTLAEHESNAERDGPMVKTTGASLDCPVAYVATTGLSPTERGSRELSGLLATQGMAVVPGIVSQVKSQFPEANGAEITNYLLTLYCPVINRNAELSYAQKRTRMLEFSTRMTGKLMDP